MELQARSAEYVENTGIRRRPDAEGLCFRRVFTQPQADPLAASMQGFYQIQSRDIEVANYLVLCQYPQLTYTWRL